VVPIKEKKDNKTQTITHPKNSYILDSSCLKVCFTNNFELLFVTACPTSKQCEKTWLAKKSKNATFLQSARDIPSRTQRSHLHRMGFCENLTGTGFSCRRWGSGGNSARRTTRVIMSGIVSRVDCCLFVFAFRTGDFRGVVRLHCKYRKVQIETSHSSNGFRNYDGAGSAVKKEQKKVFTHNIEIFDVEKQV